MLANSRDSQALIAAMALPTPTLKPVLNYQKAEITMDLQKPQPVDALFAKKYDNFGQPTQIM